MSRMCLIFDSNDIREEPQIVKYKNFLPDISFATSASLSKVQNGKGKLVFWLGLVGARNKMIKHTSQRQHFGETLPEYGSYAVKLKWDTFTDDIEIIDGDEIYLDKEYILTLCEYETGSVAITCEEQSDIFNFVKGESTPHIIQPPDYLNVYKSYLEPLSEDMDTFPFLICTGNTQIQLINIQENTVQTLINRNNKTLYG